MGRFPLVVIIWVFSWRCEDEDFFGGVLWHAESVLVFVVVGIFDESPLPVRETFIVFEVSPCGISAVSVGIVPFRPYYSVGLQEQFPLSVPFLSGWDCRLELFGLLSEGGIEADFVLFVPFHWNESLILNEGKGLDGLVRGDTVIGCLPGLFRPQPPSRPPIRIPWGLW